MTGGAELKFSVHAGHHLRFFDGISAAQDFAEQFPEARIRKDYGHGRVDVALWHGNRWTYIHQKPTKKKRKGGRS